MSWIADQEDIHVTTPFNNDPIRPRDIRSVLQKKSSSSPGPDGIPYGFLKNLPSIHHILATLFNRLIEKSQVPSAWQQASIILIHKNGDSNNPSNYRPIALTSTIGKVFNSIMSKRIQSFTRSNNIIDTKVQKGFLDNLSGCTEHSLVLQNIIRHARRTKHALHCIWLDLRNAFGSVRHDYLSFIINHYNLPQWLQSYINSLYSNICASITTPLYHTARIQLAKGVFQGDTLSPILFLLAINPILRYLAKESSYGYLFHNKRVNALAYADDLTVITSNQRAGERILKQTNEKFKAIDLHLKPSKCKSLSIVQGICKDTTFKIQDESVGNIKNNKFKFLGSTVFSKNQESNIQAEIQTNLETELKQIDQLPIRGSYRTKLYNIHTTSHLRFLLSIHNLSTSALAKMDTTTRRYLRRWLKLPNSTNIDILFHSKGLSIKLPTFLYDHGHLTTESNPSDENVSAAILEQNNNSGNCRTEHKTFITTTSKQANSKELKKKSDKAFEEHAESLNTQGEWNSLIQLQNNDSSFKALISGLSKSTYRWLFKAITITAPTMSHA